MNEGYPNRLNDNLSSTFPNSIAGQKLNDLGSCLKQTIDDEHGRKYGLLFYDIGKKLSELKGSFLIKAHGSLEKNGVYKIEADLPDGQLVEICTFDFSRIPVDFDSFILEKEKTVDESIKNLSQHLSN